ncbi:MAG: tRNA (adenosine(37)-N6)-threonylcarbamoyltransferase complex transferase subunit TsaD [Candidatus Pacearchaeota archaeon]
MIVGIETTAHTFGVGVSSGGKILANIKDMYKPESGGIIPNMGANHHRLVAQQIWDSALSKAGCSDADIEAIAVSNAPGLAPCLIAGLEFAKKQAIRLNVPLVPVNHCIAHLEIGQSVGATDPVLLYASGANTQIIAYTTASKSPRMSTSSKKEKLAGVSGKYRVFGETLDNGIGNFIDSFGRYVGLPFPAGPVLEGKAKNGNFIELPYSIKGMDVSFSGMQTKMKQLYDKGAKVEDLAYSMQEHAFAMLVEAAERALAHTAKTELVLGGGVACNARLQEMCLLMCEARGAKMFCPAKEFLTDNGAMIAYTGEILFKAGVHKNPKDVDFDARERTDMVEVSWK